MKVAHKVKLIREPEYSEVDFQLQTPCFLRSQLTVSNALTVYHGVFKVLQAVFLQ